MIIDLEHEKKIAALEAVKYLRNNTIVGLGTGSTVYYAIIEIEKLVQQGLQIQAVPTSNTTQKLAESLGIPLIDINTIDTIDITIDGADEFTEDLILIKGGGGALLREKIVASMTTEEIIITDSTKKVKKLGNFKLPVEVIPFASNYVKNQINKLGGAGYIRSVNEDPFLTDQSNYIMDVNFGIIEDPVALSDKLNTIEGIVGHGLFINLTKRVIMGSNNEIVIFER